jgi:hypothetical protein
LWFVYIVEIYLMAGFDSKLAVLLSVARFVVQVFFGESPTGRAPTGSVQSIVIYLFCRDWPDGGLCFGISGFAEFSSVCCSGFFCESPAGRAPTGSAWSILIYLFC